jgi:drug/metabolite transporter (DMT)-like permease
LTLYNKTRLFALIVVLSNVLGNVFLTWGMRRVGDPGLSPLLYLKAIFNPGVLLGITLLIVWMLSRMTLLSWADLSYVLPVTSAGYILQAVAGKLFFGEQISGWRWTGTLLIVVGIALVGLTSPRTTRPELVELKPKAKAAVQGAA